MFFYTWSRDGAVDAQLVQVLSCWYPQQVRLVLNKARLKMVASRVLAFDAFAQETGESRCFAFVDFASVEYASALMDTYPGSAGLRPPGVDASESATLIIDGRAAILEYSRRQGPATGDRGPGGSSSRCDWVCTRCSAVNFARRSNCFQVRCLGAMVRARLTPTSSALPACGAHSAAMPRLRMRCSFLRGSQRLRTSCSTRTQMCPARRSSREGSRFGLPRRWYVGVRCVRIRLSDGGVHTGGGEVSRFRACERGAKPCEALCTTKES